MPTSDPFGVLSFTDGSFVIESLEACRVTSGDLRLILIQSQAPIPRFNVIFKPSTNIFYALIVGE